MDRVEWVYVQSSERRASRDRRDTPRPAPDLPLKYDSTAESNRILSMPPLGEKTAMTRFERGTCTVDDQGRLEASNRFVRAPRPVV